MPPKRQARKGPPPKPIVKDNSEVDQNEEDVFDKFSLELRWCVEQIELALEKKKGSAKQDENMQKSRKTLTSSKTPVIKKRQVMNALFGDYRKKMAEEEKKFKIEQPKMKTKCVIPNNSIYIKKSSEQNCHLNQEENMTQSPPEVPAVGDVPHGQSDLETRSCDSTAGEHPADNIKLDNFKFKPTENSFRFNFSVSS
ncbi:UPF0488 protein C8orf33 homolog isoform X1 [Homarus americanus]|uniref:UPF0488 protein C8orf33 homolog isoform X1 n=1 Tax=Homarus americanus TaxID=6706 RepID=UPI001C48AE41|nr:UPF0488 protein C8orf33 homolog isoform X1 [Homarus americanus]